MKRGEVIRRSLNKHLDELEEQSGSYAIYQTLEDRIPGSGHGRLSTNHRGEILKRVKARNRS